MRLSWRPSIVTILTWEADAIEWEYRLEELQL
jgi:hypothetical protein